MGLILAQRPPSRGWLRAARTLGAGLLLAELGLLLLPLTGHRAYSVETGSMAPAIPPGSLVVTASAPSSTLVAGDAVTFPLPGEPGTTVTHRLVRIETGPSGPVMVTKGDANPVADAWLVPLPPTQEKVVATVPMLGILNGFAARLIIGMVAAGLLVVRPRTPGREARVRPEI